MSICQKEKYKEEGVPFLSSKYEFKNKMEVPRFVKIVINSGLGSATDNPAIINEAVNQIESIAGQRVVLTKAKKSISNFKLREGQVIGCKVTLRSERMYHFLTKLINLAIPKIRDFRGLSRKSFDGKGNYNMGFRELTIFPGVESDKSIGVNITIVTSAQSDDLARDMLESMGFPFRKG